MPVTKDARQNFGRLAPWSDPSTRRSPTRLRPETARLGAPSSMHARWPGVTKECEKRVAGSADGSLKANVQEQRRPGTAQAVRLTVWRPGDPARAVRDASRDNDRAALQNLHRVPESHVTEGNIVITGVTVQLAEQKLARS